MASSRSWSVCRLAFLLALMISPGLLIAAEPNDEKEPSFWMKKKIEYSQNILLGLAKADFAAIEKNARSMSELTQLEKWLRGNTAEYKSQLVAFQAANKGLLQMAQDKNIDGATLAYMQLTLSCVQCHKLVRDADTDRPGKN